jgi:hypothetical protein
MEIAEVPDGSRHKIFPFYESQNIIWLNLFADQQTFMTNRPDLNPADRDFTPTYPNIILNQAHTASQAIDHQTNYNNEHSIFLKQSEIINKKRETWYSKEGKGVKLIKDHLDSTIYRTIRELNSENVRSLEKSWKALNYLIKNPKDIDLVYSKYESYVLQYKQSITHYYLNQSDYTKSLNIYGRIITNAAKR